MSADNPHPSKRSRHASEDLSILTKEDLVKRCQKQQEKIEHLQTKRNSGDDSSEKYKSSEPSRRENVLVMRLANKEQEVQEYVAQINHNKKVQEDAALLSLRQTNLDPGINLLFGKMREELQQTKSKLEQAQSELSAWKFTPDSQNGKKLISRCRTLIAENQELGRQLSHGKAAQLEAELALQKKYSEELKASQDELNEFVIQLDEEVEGMQSTIQVLQRELAAAKQENEEFKKIIDAYENSTYLKDENEVITRDIKSDYADSTPLVSDDNSVNGDNDFEMASDERTMDQAKVVGYARTNKQFEFDNKDSLGDVDPHNDVADYVMTEEVNSPGTPTSESARYDSRTRTSSSQTPTSEQADDVRSGDAWDDRTNNLSGESVSGDIENDDGSSSYDTDEGVAKVQIRAATPLESDHENHCSPLNDTADENMNHSTAAVPDESISNNVSDNLNIDKPSDSNSNVAEPQNEYNVDTKTTCQNATKGSLDITDKPSLFFISNAQADIGPSVGVNALMSVLQNSKTEGNDEVMRLQQQDAIKLLTSQVLMQENCEARTAPNEDACDAALRNNHALSLNGVGDNSEL